MNLDKLACELIDKMNLGQISSTAYDTAWIARLAETNSAIGKPALEWLCEHQLADGTWGAPEPYYAHDRIVSTLAATVALARLDSSNSNKKFIEKGLIGLEKLTSETTEVTISDPNLATIGFEMITPVLVEEAQHLGILKQHAEKILGNLACLRALKLQKIRGKRICRQTSMAFSAEMAGIDNLDILDIPNLREKNGSVGNSPAASAYYLDRINENETAVLNYLTTAMNPDGGFPNVTPFDVFEKTWSLWSFGLCNSWETETLQKFTEPLNYLSKTWLTGQGVGFSAHYSVPDGDCTSIVYAVLKRFGYDVDIETVCSYEETDCFRCFHAEAGVSYSTNLHALIALGEAGLDIKHPSVQKILNFLEQQTQPFLRDKWHSSPYYVTSRLAIACAKYHPDLARKTIDWMIKTQRKDGSWGYYFPTAEETGFCLQALCVWQKLTAKVPADVIKKGKSWLEANYDRPYQSLWIGKALYAPELVVRATVLGALAQAREV